MHQVFILIAIAFSADERIQLDQLMQTMLRILRGQEQIKATQVDIKNTLPVVMHNTIPAEPKLGGIKEEMCLPVKSLALFDLMGTDTEGRNTELSAKFCTSW